MRCDKCGAEIGEEPGCNVCGSGFPPPQARKNASWRYVVGAVVGVLVLFAINAALSLFIDYFKRPSRASMSMNHIKQLALGVQMYSQDYQGMCPGWVPISGGGYAHNTWDQQIEAMVRGKDIYSNGDAGIKSYSQPGTHDRVLTYGLNGLLITPPKAKFDGNADFASLNASHPPRLLRLGALSNAANTILLAELSTKSPMPGIYGARPDPLPFSFSGDDSSRQWRDAHDGWIDISPRGFIEIANDASNNPYKEPYGRNAETGIARDLYGGGGIYAFADGHVKFMKIGKTVGLGTTVNGKTITDQNCWEVWNTNNMWNPQ
jgi:prepilin-type processing-associated H-X9-DG protein